MADGSNLFQDAAQAGVESGQADVKSLQTGADMMGDIVEKNADANLKQGENQRANQKLPYDIESIKADVQQRMAEAQLNQQKYEEARRNNLGAAFQSAQGMMTKLYGTDLAYLKTPSVQAQIARVAQIHSQMGIQTTPEDIEASLKDPNLRAQIQSVSSHFLSADPSEVGDAMDQAKRMGLSSQDFYAEDGLKALRTAQAAREKNEADVEAARLRGPEIAWSPEAIQARKDLAQINTGGNLVNKTFPAQAEAISKQVQQIKTKWDPDIVRLKNLQNFVKLSPSQNNGVMQIGAMDDFVREVTGSGRPNQAQYEAVGASQGKIMGIVQKIKANIGYADKDGSMQLGKFLTGDEMRTLSTVSGLIQSNATKAIVQEAYGPYTNYNDLKNRAASYGYKMPPSVMDPELYNLVKSYDDQHHFDQNTGTFTSPAPTQKTSGQKAPNKRAAAVTLTTQEKNVKSNLMKAMKWTDQQAQDFIMKKRKKQ